MLYYRKNVKGEIKMSKQTKAEALKRQEETLSTFRKLDNNIWLMEYKCSYGLDALLEKGVSNMNIFIIIYLNE